MKHTMTVVALFYATLLLVFIWLATGPLNEGRNMRACSDACQRGGLQMAEWASGHCLCAHVETACAAEWAGP